jgi:hypothetical protein
MKKKNLGSFGLVSVLTMGTALAQGATANDASLDPIAPHQHGPLRHHVPHYDGTSASTNWSGYAVSGTNFTDARGSWVVPAVDCSVSPSTYSAFWVGIDGYNSTTVEQTGTSSDCSGSSPRYYAWYEFYPFPSRTVYGLKVKPGDRMSAEISYSGSMFTLTITNETTGQAVVRTKRVRSAKRNSAEWIAEAPCCQSDGSSILPLADFGTVNLGLDYTNVSNTNFASSSAVSGPIGAFGSNADQIDMVSSDGSTLKATTSSLSADGTSFQVIWNSQ